MESTFSHNCSIVYNILEQLIDSCELLMKWNEKTTSVDDYLTSPEGMRDLAASCMLLESIGEGVKKIDKLLPGFLVNHEPDMPWREIKGLRDHIAHGYFDLDASIIFDVVVNEIPSLKTAFKHLQSNLQQI